MWVKIASAVWVALGVAVFLVGNAWASDEVHEGKVAAVGESTISVVDQMDGDTDMFTVTASTKVTYNGKPAKLSAIQIGDRVKVTATTEGGKMVAKEIAARSPE